MRDGLWYLDVNELEAGLYERALAAVSAARREKALRYRFERDRKLSLGAELLLMYARAQLGCAPEIAAYAYGENGKPYFPDLPGFHFNLSHTAHFALCAVSACPVGCDAEAISSVDLSLPRRFFLPAEYALIAAQETQQERSTLFTRFWTLKESFMKATGLGMALAPDRFEIDLSGREIRVLQQVSGERFSFREYADIPGCRAAVCVLGGAFEAEMERVNAQTLLPR